MTWWLWLIVGWFIGCSVTTFMLFAGIGLARRHATARLMRAAEAYRLNQHKQL